jgi:hypothetical protein
MIGDATPKGRRAAGGRRIIRRPARPRRLARTPIRHP